MLPLDAYREAIHLDEPFDGPETDPRNNFELIDVALRGLPRTVNVDERFSSTLFNAKDLMEILRIRLMALEPGRLNREVSNAISVLLYRYSGYRGRTTGANLMRVSEMWPFSDYASSNEVAVWRGDVRELVVDAVVNAALPDLDGCHDPMHPCIDNDIHSQAGPWLREDCAAIHELQGSDEKVGGAKLTRGYRLPARYVLHTVSPRIVGGVVTDADRDALASCYTSCLDLAAEKGDIHTVSFCALSTGQNGFPFEEATHIALATVNQWLLEHGTDVIQQVIFNILEDDDSERYSEALSHWVED